MMKLVENRVWSAAPETEAAFQVETPARLITELLKPTCSVWPRIWAGFMRRTHNWRIPPRWSSRDWREEIDAEIFASACHAIRNFDPSRGPSLASFVYHTMLASALARYRKEWSYALRCGASALPGEDRSPPVELTDGVAALEEEQRLMRSMTDLPEKDRRLIERLYWEGWTETDVALGMGISQQAVSKRKQKILKGLRETLLNL
jgi:RNA polymerase sigma factor (sigma-70 family)